MEEESHIDIVEEPLFSFIAKFIHRVPNYTKISIFREILSFLVPV
jgi:hypothetical protein